MRTFAAAMALASTAASLASAFVGSPLPLRALSRPSCSASRVNRVRSCVAPRMTAKEDDDEEIKVYYASEVTDGNVPSKIRTELGEEPLPENTEETETDRYGPVKYDNLVDGDAFDGGDGQVGVVGDGSNAMETFDKSGVVKKADAERARVKSSTFVTDSRSRQRVAWGSSTGYADELKEKGMVKENLKGEDISKIRRQQFENWRNQQEVTNMQRARIQEMDLLTGEVEEDAGPKWKRAKKSYFDTLNKGAKASDDDPWNTYKAPEASAKKDGTEWEATELKGDEKIEDTVQCISTSGYPGHASIEVRNTVMTFEPFHCTFVGDTTGFGVEPAEGTLARRGGEPTVLDVKYLGKGPADNRIGTLVVETEEDKWVYKVEGVMQ